MRRRSAVQDPRQAARGEFRRALIVLGVLILLFGVLGWRLVQLQARRHAEFVAEKSRHLNSRLEWRGVRGAVTDARGRVLASSVETLSCAIDPKLTRKAGVRLEEAIGQAGALLELTPRQLQRAHENADRPGSRFAWLRRHCDPERVRAVKAAEIPGVHFIREYDRTYPLGMRAAHILGFTDIDSRGLEGVEALCEPLLRGAPAARAIQRDARRRRLLFDGAELDPERWGLTVELSLDATIQEIAERALDGIVESFEPAAATAIVLDPYTGDLLALANRPAFDPNTPNGGPVANRLNPAIASVFEPGSTFKPFVWAAALEGGAVRLGQTFDCEHGAWSMPGGRVLHDAHGYGGLTAEFILIKSSNIGMAKIARELGMPGLYAAVRRFGFGEPTGLGLPGELSGMVRPLAEWTGYSMGSVPMGHEIAVTPIQLTTAYAALANGGLLLRPRLVRAVRDGTGALVHEFPVTVRRRVLSPEMAALTREVLGKVVEFGTGRRAQTPAYALGGKTGTAQLLKTPEEVAATGSGGYSETRFSASFVAIAPHDVPRIVVLVTVREPKGSHYGGVVAAPAARDIARDSLQYLRVPREDVARRMAAATIGEGN